MPPKKSKATNGDGEEAGGAFRWTLENERKLLILTKGRYLTSEDYERLLTVFPGTNLNGVKIKCSRFRVEQRNMYEELGWTLPEGGAGHSGTKRKKMGVSKGDDGDEEKGGPTKKPRAKKAGGKKDGKKASGEEEEVAENELGGSVKQE
ncbi:hypothetical protein EK21DRAFT_69884 [Setomelanomma holmii]|uniref:Uncharacterized protein n=1 Tax=Setomelanomma holmii TaxID=210430 RepID=A0A9P4LK70_9PLEO|nr:hypothetical protein EK21DRAFT_69884 [Setomelanomma holmii]